MDFDLILAILTLLNRIGDGEAMPSVRLLAAANFRYNAEERVIVAARQCLKILDSRRVKEQERTTLLRPAARDANSDKPAAPRQFFRNAAGTFAAHSAVENSKNKFSACRGAAGTPATPENFAKSK